jgi:hypothetical protein
MLWLILFTGVDNLKMNNCFTTAYKYLNLHYTLPQSWKGWTVKDMETFVKDEKKFLGRKDHIGFFRSFCSKVKEAKKDDIVLTRTSVGVAINRFTYWVYNEDLERVEHKMLDNNCLIMRINNG